MAAERGFSRSSGAQSRDRVDIEQAQLLVFAAAEA